MKLHSEIITGARVTPLIHAHPRAIVGAGNTIQTAASTDSIQATTPAQLQKLIGEEVQKALKPSTGAHVWRTLNGISMAAMAAGMIWMTVAMTRGKHTAKLIPGTQNS